MLAENETLGDVFIKGPHRNLFLMKANKGTALAVGIR